jgi:integrase
VESVKDHRDGNLIAFAVYTGMRQGELLALTWGSVDLEQGKVRVVQTVGCIKEKFVFRQTAKSKRSRRTVSLDQKALNALKRQKKMVAEEKLQEKNYQDSDLVFPNKQGDPAHPSLLCRRFKRLASKTPHNITFHSLRHSHATYLLELGIHPGIVQARLGIETIGILMDTYSHVTDKMQEDVIRKMNDIPLNR